MNEIIFRPQFQVLKLCTYEHGLKAVWKKEMDGLLRLWGYKIFLYTFLFVFHDYCYNITYDCESIQLGTKRECIMKLIKCKFQGLGAGVV